MKKTLKTIALAGALIISSTAVFAEMPVFTAIIGNKAFDLEYVNDKKNVDEIRPLILEHAEFTYVKMLNGKWIDNLTGVEVPKELLPMVEYKDKDGNITKYNAMDGEQVKEETNPGGGTGGGSDNADKDKEELDKLKEKFKINSAHVYLDNGNKIYAKDIEDKYNHIDYYEIDIREMGEAQLMGVKFQLPKGVTAFKGFMPFSDEVAFERSVSDTTITIDCQDEDVKKYDNGEPGIGLKTLIEKASSFSKDGDYVEIRGELHDGEGNTQRVNVIIKVK